MSGGARHFCGARAVVVSGLLLGFSGCAAQQPRASAPAVNAPTALGGADAEPVSRLIALHNRERLRAGLAPLRASRALMAAAQEHAADMARRRWMSHRGGDLSSPARRAERAGYRYRAMGENVAAGQASADDVMRDWMHSPGHRHNVLGPYEEIGIGYAHAADNRRYWCVDFGARVGAAAGKAGIDES